MNECLSEIIGRVRTQSLVVVVSDFADVLYGRVRLDEDILSGLVARHKENVIFLILDDEHEFSWSGGVGTIMSRGIETGKLKEIRMSHAGLIRAEHAEKQLKFQKYLEDQGIDSLVLSSSNWLDRLTEFAATRHGLSTV